MLQVVIQPCPAKASLDTNTWILQVKLSLQHIALLLVMVIGL